MKFRRFIAALSIAAFTAVGGLFVVAPPAQAATGAAVFFIPHQDDETLTMGADIRAHYLAGRVVVIVVVTDGSASNAWAKVNTKLAGEGKPPITLAQFVAGRNAEQFEAIHKLAPTARTYYENYTDGTLTVAQATTVINKYVAAWPDGSYKTMSWLDLHPDHINLGNALRNLCNAGSIPNNDCRFEQFRRYWTSMPIAGGFVAGNATVTSAYASYKLWNPAIGRYSIGNLSVPADFTAAYADPRSKYHSP